MRARLTACALVFGAALAQTTGASAESRTAPEAYFARRCANSPTSAVLACVHRASIRYHQSYREARYVAFRESRYNPGICNAQGSGACGLFQFMPGTFAYTPQSRFGSVFSAKWSSLAAMWMWAHGYKSHWATA